MTSQADIKKGKQLLKYYRETTGKPVNVIKDHWGFAEMVSIMTVKEIKDLIDYFALLNNNENITWFYNNYDSLEEAKMRRDKDLADRKKIMQETKERSKNWKQNSR